MGSRLGRTAGMSDVLATYFFEIALSFTAAL
jgi:hypothetical protein